MPKRSTKTIVALGGGGFNEEDDLSLDAWLIGLCQPKNPKVCFVPTASGDSEIYIRKFLDSYESLGCATSVLRLFQRDVEDPADFLCQQDLVFVGGGNTVNLLAVWRAHGVDQALGEAYRHGVILSGVSAGALCWFEAGITDSFGPYRELCDGLGILEGSFCPHFDSEAARRPLYEHLIAEGRVPPGMAANDWVALMYSDGELVKAVSAREGATATRYVREQDRAVGQSVFVSLLSPEPKPKVQAAIASSNPSQVKPNISAETVVYTDGACSGNPGPGGWAWAVVGGAFKSGAERKTTNQRMEITAAYEAVKSVDGPLLIMSDSTYVVNCFKQNWWKNWLRNGWKNSQKKPVANRDLWEPFIELVRARRQIRFQWVKGHGTDTMNQWVDELAVEAGQRQKGRHGVKQP